MEIQQVSDLPVSSEVRVVTPEEAAQYLEHNQLEQQRKLQPGWVTYLQQEMISGMFRAGTEISFARFDGRMFLTNGQHTLTAMVNTSLPQKLTVITTEAATFEQVQWLYAKIDRGRGRTVRDMIVALDLHQRFDVPPSYIGKSLAGLRLMYTNFIPQRVYIHDDQLVNLIEEHIEYIQIYFVAAYRASSDIRASLARSSALAVGVHTLKNSPPDFQEEAQGFWADVAHGEPATVGYPPAVFAHHLVTTTFPSGGSVRAENSGKLIVNPNYTCRVGAACWNAFVRNRNINTLPKQEIKRPKFIFPNGEELE